MRVLIVVHAFPPVSAGGSEVYADAHARTLARGGDDVLVVTREQDEHREEYRVRQDDRDGMQILRINNTFRRIASFEDSYRNAEINRIVCGIVDEFRPDVAHIHHLTCLSTEIVPSLAERRIPIVFTLHDYWLMCHRGQLFDLDQRVCGGPDAHCGRCIGAVASPAAFAAAQIAKRVPLIGRGAAALAPLFGNAERSASEMERRTKHMREIAAHVSRFLTPSEDLRRRFVAFGIPADRITHMPLGFERTPFHRSARPGRARNLPLRLGFVGSLMISKAPHIAIAAVRGLGPDAATLDLYGALTAYHGDNRYPASLAPLLAARGVTHHGHLPRERVADAFVSMDALVLSSVWPENSPLVIHEAFLAGVPVVAPRIGGIPELVQHDVNGLLFEPGDVDELQRALTRLVQEEGLLERLRAGIGAVRSIEEDVAATRALYAGLKPCATSSTRRIEHDAELKPGAASSARRIEFDAELKPGAPSSTKKIELDAGRSPAAASTATARQIVAQDFSPATGSRQLAAVVLNYRTPDHTYLAVRSLLASRRPIDDLIVVENDEEANDRGDKTHRHLEHVHHIRTGRNLGFSGGVNVGIRDALARGADAVLLINSDLVLPPDCVDRLERAMTHDDPRRAIVAPVIADRSSPGTVESLGLSFNPETGRMRSRGAGVPLDASGCIEPVDAVSACAVLIGREVFAAIGLFDEDYFFSFEDLDFCLRARRAGFGTFLVGNAIAYHEGSRSIGSTSSDRLYFAARNHLLLAARSATDSSSVRWMLRTTSIVLLNLAHAITAGGPPLPLRLAAVIQGTRDFAAGRFGARK